MGGIDTSFVAIDFETASSTQRASACALGFAVVRSSAVVNSAKILINPAIAPKEWTPINTRIHGIRYEDVRGAPKFFDAWRRLRDEAQGLPIVAHNASFDLSVLRSEHDRSGTSVPGYRYACSAQLAAHTWPDLRSVSLPVVAEHLGIQLEHHNPASDARAAALVVLAALAELRIGSLDAALEEAGLRWGEVFSPTSWIPCGRAYQVSHGTDETVDRHIDPNHPFFGHVVVFTGPLGSMSRGLAEAHIRAIGGIPRDSVTKKTSFVVVGGFKDLPESLFDGDLSTKHRRAMELRAEGGSIVLISEAEFLAML